MRMNKAIIFFYCTVFSGCVATLPPVDTSLITYKSDSLRSAEFSTSSLAILPVLAGEGYEGFRRLTADKIHLSCQTYLPKLRSISFDQTMDKINNAQLSEAYSEVIDVYSRTAILKKENLRAIGSATGCRFLLYSRVGTKASSKTDYFGDNVIQTSVREVEIFAQIWDTESGDVAWEGSGGAAGVINSETGQLQELIALAADGLAKRLGISASEAPVSSSGITLLEQMQSEKKNALLFLVLGALAVAVMAAYAMKGMN